MDKTKLLSLVFMVGIFLLGISAKDYSYGLDSSGQDKGYGGGSYADTADDPNQNNSGNYGAPSSDAQHTDTGSGDSIDSGDKDEEMIEGDKEEQKNEEEAESTVTFDRM